MCFNKSILQLFQTYKNFQGKVQADPVIDHTVSSSKYNPLARSNYIKLPKELDHPRKGLINIHDFHDNEYFNSVY